MVTFSGHALVTMEQDLICSKNKTAAAFMTPAPSFQVSCKNNHIKNKTFLLKVKF
jgi:hypothetical protein